MREEDPFKKVREELEKMELPDQATEHEPEEVDEVEARFRELEAKHAAERPDLPDTSDLDDRFKKLEAQVGSVRDRQAQEQREAARRRATESSDAKGMGLGLTAAYAIIGMPLVGAGIGWLIDSQLGTVIWKGTLCLLGAIVGIGFAVTAANRKH